MVEKETKPQESTKKVLVFWRPTKMLPSYHTVRNEEHFQCYKAGAYEVDRELCDKLCAQFPQNFRTGKRWTEPEPETSKTVTKVPINTSGQGSPGQGGNPHDDDLD